MRYMKTSLIATLSVLLSVNAASASQPILMVDDDNGRKYESKYQAWFNHAGLEYICWETKIKGTPSNEVMKPYHTVFWFTGSSYDAINQEESNQLKLYLDDHTKHHSLMITGDKVATSLNHGFNDMNSFLGWYLNCRYIRTDGNAKVGVNERSDVFQFAFLPMIFNGYNNFGDYGFNLWGISEIVKPNDWSHRSNMMPVKNPSSRGNKDNLESVAISNNRMFKTVFVAFDLANEDSYYINEPEFIRTCIDWLQR